MDKQRAENSARHVDDQRRRAELLAKIDQICREIGERLGSLERRIMHAARRPPAIPTRPASP
jgi:hypothetical protein